MGDVAAPLLKVFDDPATAYVAFVALMGRIGVRCPGYPCMHQY